MGVSAAINGGNLYTPYLLSSITNPNTYETLLLNKPVLKRNVISEKSSETVRFALESVVAKGTGRNAFVNGHRIGGKTGTAQKVSNGAYLDNNYILSFIGFMPADDPDYIVYVAVDYPKGVTQYGGTVSAPIAKSIFEGIIDLYDLPKDDDGITREYELWDVKYYEIPEVVGYEKKDAIKAIGNSLRIEFSGTGNKVIDVSPKSGAFVKQGGIVKLMLGN